MDKRNKGLLRELFLISTIWKMLRSAGFVLPIGSQNFPRELIKRELKDSKRGLKRVEKINLGAVLSSPNIPTPIH